MQDLNYMIINMYFTLACVSWLELKRIITKHRHNILVSEVESSFVFDFKDSNWTKNKQCLFYNSKDEINHSIHWWSDKQSSVNRTVHTLSQLAIDKTALADGQQGQCHVAFFCRFITIEFWGWITMLKTYLSQIKLLIYIYKLVKFY